MTETRFRELLQRAENDTIDFKEEMYSFKGDCLADLLKDVISMANTPRDGSAYLLCGVEWKPGSLAVAKGMSQQIDDVELHEQLTGDEISPVPPAFVYHPFLVDGKHFGVIDIPPERTVGPFYPTKDRGNKLLRDVLYVRSGGGNSRANREQTRKVYNWFGRIAPPGDDATGDQWERFLNATDDLDASGHYLLIADSQRRAHDCVGLGHIPWLAVVDFDPSSEVSGLLCAMRSALQESRTVQLAVKGERPPIYTRNHTVWYFARGLLGRQDTLATSEARIWLRDYGRELDSFLEHISKAALPAPVTVLVLWEDVSSLKLMSAALDSVVKGLGEAARIVAVVNDPKVEEAVTVYGATSVAMDVCTLAKGISHVMTRRRHSAGDIVLPTPTGTPCPIAENDRLWLEEELELVHHDAWREGPDHPEPFRRGQVVSWRDLDLHHDCERSVTSALSARVLSDLKDRLLTRINLFHPAGAGGTTVARRVAWDVHARFPTVQLRNLVPHHTSGRLAKIASLTQSAVLCVVDGGQFRDSEIDDLYAELRSQQTAVVLIQVVRRFQRQTISGPSGAPRRTFWLPMELDSVEAERFRAVYSQAVAERNSQFDAIAQSDDARARTAFYFGLSAYGRGFQGLPSYVKSRLDSLNEAQRQLVGFLALSHHYGQQALPAQCFAPLLGLPRDRIVNLTRVLTPEAMELLIPADEETWRTAHDLIAEEVLRQLLSPQESSDDSAWKQQLSAWAVDFIHMLRADWQTPGDQIVDVAVRVFVVRDNSELLGTESAVQSRFGQLIEDIPSVHGRMEVLRQLAELFPDQAHFHAHLGRFMGLNGRHEEATNAINRALQLSPKDALLHHMRGMILRYHIRAKMETSSPLGEIIPVAQEAREAFARSRQYNEENEHGYISDIQLIVRVLDYAARQSVLDVKSLVYSPGANPFLREAIEGAEDLMFRVREMRGGDRPSGFEMDCRAKLDALYGDHKKALQGWDSLLSRQGVARPPIRRQIVWTHLHRSSGNWKAMRTRDVDHCRSLLEKNLEDQPSDGASMRLWLQAVRHSSSPASLDSLIERVSYWKSNSITIDSAYYLYVLHSLAAYQGSPVSRDDAMRALEECKALARFRQKRTWSYEWIGTDDGIRGLIHQTDLGEWENDFFQHLAPLARIKGRVAELRAAQQGKIELECGLPAFFVPTVAGLQLGRDENRQVECYIGFSYEGLRAWQVQAT